MAVGSDMCMKFYTLSGEKRGLRRNKFCLKKGIMHFLRKKQQKIRDRGKIDWTGYKKTVVRFLNLMYNNQQRVTSLGKTTIPSGGAIDRTH